MFVALAPHNPTAFDLHQRLSNQQHPTHKVLAHFFVVTSALGCRMRGARIFAVGDGKSIRTPLSNKAGRYESGMLECIKGLFLYRSICAVSPCSGSFQEASKDLLRETGHFVKPAKCS
mmetsp:Transcript_52116/g.82733  ORF Transcript_52116/g.82733 Transcript_52116/m.82733 type:complete len:118 (-) Transcript_52116:741-1094(-)